jgi:hypothetical protein
VVVWGGGWCRDEQAGGEQAEPEAQGECDGGPGQGRVEGGGKLGACQGAHIGEGAGKGQEHGGQHQQELAGLPPAAAQLPDGGNGRHPTGRRDEGPVHLGHYRGGRGGERPGSVDQVGGHRDHHQQGEQAEPAAPAGGCHHHEGDEREQDPRPGRGAGHPDNVALDQRGALAQPQGDLPVGDDDLVVAPVGGDRRRVGSAPVGAVVMPHRLWLVADPAPPWRGGWVQLWWDAAGCVGVAVGIATR